MRCRWNVIDDVFPEDVPPVALLDSGKPLCGAHLVVLGMLSCCNNASVMCLNNRDAKAIVAIPTYATCKKKQVENQVDGILGGRNKESPSMHMA